MRRLVIFLIRKRLGLKKYEHFKFTNQKTDAEYWFTSIRLLKCLDGVITRSNVSLNWLLNDACTILRVEHKNIKKEDYNANLEIHSQRTNNRERSQL